MRSKMMPERRSLIRHGAGGAVGSDRDTKTVTITIVGTNDLPTIVGTQAGIQITDKQTAQPFTNVTINDVDEHGLQNLTTRVSFNSASGALTNLSGFSLVSPGVYNFNGIGSAVTTALRNLRFVPVENRIPVPTPEMTRFTIRVDDGYAATPVTDDVTTVIVTPVNEAPTISGTIANERVYQYSSIRLFAGVTIRDVDDLTLQPLRVTVTINDATHGNLSSLGGFVNLGGGVYRLGSTNAGVTAAQATIALRNLLFNPTTSGRVNPGTPETTGFAITVEDNFAAPVVNSLTTVIAIHEFSAKLLANDALASDQFGSAVAATRDVAIVGAPLDNNERGADAGAVYVYVRQPATEQWTQLQKVLSGDGDASDQFGGAVAIDGDTFVVGARLAPGIGSSGAAYVFQRTGTGANSWTQVAKLLPSDAVATDEIGISVSISGDVIAVGSHLDDDHGTSSGSVYLFSRNQGGVNKWGQVKKIVAADAAGGDQFGSAVNLFGNILAVGSPLDVHNGVSSGSAYLFNRTQGGANNWGQIKKIVSSDAANADRFGASVCLDGTTLVVGAPRQSQLGIDAGAAYVFVPQGGSDNWQQSKKLLPPLTQNNDQFGSAVSISQDKIIVGSPLQGRLNVNDEFGAAYLFTEDQGGILNWGLVQIVDRADAHNGDRFGTDTTISSNTVVVGVPLDDDGAVSSGSAYVYRVKYNNAPVVALTISNQTIGAGSPLVFSIPPGTFAEVDIRDSLRLSTFVAGGAPGWLSFNPASNQFTGTPNATGQYTIFVVATDEDEASVTNSFTLSVVPSFANSLQNWR